MKILMVCLGLLVWSQSAYGLFETNLSIGQRMVTGETDEDSDETIEVSGTEFYASLLISPIPVAPVALGLFVGRSSFDMTEEFDEVYGTALLDVDEVTINTTIFGPELKVWAPLPFAKPFLRARLLFGFADQTTVISTSASETKTDYEYSVSGHQIGGGLEFSIVPMLGLFLEYSINEVDLETTKTTTATTIGSTTTTTTDDNPENDDDDSDDDEDVSIALGISFGF